MFGNIQQVPCDIDRGTISDAVCFIIHFEFSVMKLSFPIYGSAYYIYVGNIDTFDVTEGCENTKDMPLAICRSVRIQNGDENSLPLMFAALTYYY